MRKRNCILIVGILLITVLVFNINTVFADNEEINNDSENIGEIEENNSTINSNLGATETRTVSWPSLSNSNVSLTSNGRNNYDTVFVNLSGISSYSDFEFCVGISNSASTAPTNYTAWSSSGKFDISNLYELNNDLYLFVKAQGVSSGTDKLGQEKIILEGVKLERTCTNQLGEKFHTTILDNRIKVISRECISDGRKINVKVCRISDSSLLNEIRNGSSGWRNKLLTAVINGSAVASATGTINSGIANIVLGSNVQLVDGAYYGIMISADDENGKYYPVQDILFAQGNRSETDGSTWLITNIKWGENSSSEENTGENGTPASGEEKPTSLPRAGKATIGGFIALGIAGVAFTFIKLRKYRDVK